MNQNDDLISRRAAIDALHTWFRDGFDEDKWWNSTHVLAAIEGLPFAEQEIINCFECIHYKPMSSSWGKCYVHSSRTERYRTCQSCDYCSWAERRQDD